MAGIMTINSDLNPSMAEIKKSIFKALEENKARNLEMRRKLVDFYNGEQGLDKYLRDYGFSDVSDMPLEFINITEKIINKISLVYKSPPDRELATDSEQEVEFDEYNRFIKDNPEFNISIREAERLKRLLGNVILRPMFYQNKWRFFIETEWIPYFDEGDPLHPIAYSIPVRRDLNVTNMGKITDRQWYMYWSDDDYFWHDENGEVKADPNFPEMINPFGLIPFIELRKNLPVEEYWPTGEIDLVQANQAINVLINNLNYAIHFQSFDQPWAKGVRKEDVDNGMLKMGVNKILASTDQGTDFGLLGFSPKISETIDAIKGKIEMIAQRNNINIGWSMSGDVQSGFALLIKNIDLMEARQEDVDYAEMQEQRIYDVIRVQVEYFKLTYKLPDVNVLVNFQEIDFPVNYKESIDQKEWELKHNIISEIDLIQSKHQVDEAEARRIWESNKRINQRFGNFGESLARNIGGANEP
jgi:hypothetical protein